MMTRPPYDAKDRALGLDRRIDRRDFVSGAAIGVGALVAGAAGGATAEVTGQNAPNYYPPSLTGLRGSHPGAFENAHALRDGTFWASAKAAHDKDRPYDLVIVGGGLSGLAAAYFYRQVKPNAHILILENHDDFGGHAKRNEFHLDGRLHLLNGGTLEIDSPRPYSAIAAGLLKELGVDPVALGKASDRTAIYAGLSPATFFDHDTFGADKLVLSGGARWEGGATTASWSRFAAEAPLSPAAKADLLRLETGDVDYLPGLTSDEKKDRLSRISYRDFLLQIVKVDPKVADVYQARTHGEWGVGIDAEPALDCWALGFPGFTGMKLKPGSAPRMGNTAAGYADGGSYSFHFPDGNASLARLLVRQLIPAALPGSTVEDAVTARADYSVLDREGSPVRIRLNSTVVGVRNIGDPESSRGVEIAYVRGGQVYRVHASACVLAGWNMMIPYLCPELPASQKAALHELVKVPLVYTSVALRNWRAFKALGVRSIYSPGGYFSSLQLNWAMDIGDYTSVRSPDEPILVHLTRTPCQPGLVERDQHRAGRAELLSTPFETYERNIRDQMGRMLGAGGFDPALDITAITVNRWPHGYAYEYNPLFDPDVPLEQRPHIIGRKRFGRIAIANSDSGAAAYTDSAFDQARRAVDELLSA